MAGEEDAMHAVLKEAVDLVPENKATHYTVFFFFFHVHGIF